MDQAITDTLEKTPRDATHWSTRTLAKELALSHATVGRIWRAFGLQPHRSETVKLSRDPLFVDKVRDKESQNRFPVLPGHHGRCDRIEFRSSQPA